MVSASRGDDADPDVTKVAQRLASHAATKRVVAELLASRQRRETASREIETSIDRLSDLNVGQRDIAALAGVSQAEVSRRLQRRRLAEGEGAMREIVGRRAAREITTPQMVDQIVEASGRSKKPGRSGAYDGASTVTGSAAELTALVQQGLISRSQYENIRRRIAEKRSSAR